jgi:3-hydroxyanthranilate 3,4-dioxygenase
MERTRPSNNLDKLRWYCTKGKHPKPTIIREELFHCTDLGTQLKPLVNNWMENEDMRVRGVCGCFADAK